MLIELWESSRDGLARSEFPGKTQQLFLLSFSSGAWLRFLNESYDLAGADKADICWRETWRGAGMGSRAFSGNTLGLFSTFPEGRIDHNSICARITAESTSLSLWGGTERIGLFKDKQWYAEKSGCHFITLFTPTVDNNKDNALLTCSQQQACYQFSHLFAGISTIWHAYYAMDANP